MLRAATLAGCLCTFAVLGGCTNAQAGALWGAGIGALLGHDAESAIIGSAVGAGIGYIIGNEADKQMYRDHHYYHESPYGHYDY